jgi:hypothetical protein
MKPIAEPDGNVYLLVTTMHDDAQYSNAPVCAPAIHDGERDIHEILQVW